MVLYVNLICIRVGKFYATIVWGLLERSPSEVRLNRALHPGTDLNLRARRLGADLEVRVTERLSNGVDTDEGTRRQEVLALDIAGTLGVDLRPLGNSRILGEEIMRVQLLARVAALGLIRRRHRDSSDVVLGTEARQTIR